VGLLVAFLGKGAAVQCAARVAGKPTSTSSVLSNLMADLPVPEMSADARMFWNRLAPWLIENGVIDHWSAATFGRLCWLWAKATPAVIDEDGPPAVGAASGEPVRHPVWTPSRPG
jgi:hypothetical protein